MKCRAVLGGVLLLTAGLTGCVERRFVIESDPPGALVLMNGQPLGATPVDGHFLFYGDYNFTLIKDGYETQQVCQHIASPWYQYFPLDFFSENIYPCKLEDVRRFRYSMTPQVQPRTDDLINRAEQLRAKGRAVESPAP